MRIVFLQILTQTISVLSFFFCLMISLELKAQTNIVWQIGDADNSSSGMALSPAGYKDFLANDFGYEDRFFLIGHSDANKDFPYVLPGPDDIWGGTWHTSGIRSHQLNILFGIDELPANDNLKLVVDLLGYNVNKPALFQIKLNNSSWNTQLEQIEPRSVLVGDTITANERLIEIPMPAGLLRKGGNTLTLTSLDGSWVVFDQVRMEGSPNTKLSKAANLFVRGVKVADYEIESKGKNVQPLLVDLEHLSGAPELTVRLDGRVIFKEKVEKGRYEFEVPMPSVARQKQSRYEIFADGQIVASGTVNRSKQPLARFADYVDTKMGAAHSRWMIAPGPWMPFSMVKIGPDNQNDGWQAGYDPTFESIGAFSHIHEWTMGGLGMLPVKGPLKIKVGDERSKPGEGYRSAIDKSTEEAPIGYYKVHLTDYDITAEITATTRASFQRYTYPKDTDGRIMIDLQTPAENKYLMPEVTLKKVSDHRLEGYSKQVAPDVWHGIPNDYIVHFVIEFDRPIKKFGTWINNDIKEGDIINVKNANDAGAFVEFETKEHQVVQVRTGISYVSIDGASKNLETEITRPFGWNFNAVHQHQRQTWDKLLGRLKITTNDRIEKSRFYTNMYRALCSRNIFSDVDGRWVDATEKIQQMKDPGSVALGCDAFWNTFWNLNQFWNLVTPEWSSKWVKSQLAMYDANGWLAKGPAGMEYVPVMVAEHEVPLLTSAYQMGIRDYDVSKLFEASYKTLTTRAEKIGGGIAGNADLEAFVKYKFVPYDKGRFSNTLEYAFDNWTLSQLAKSLNKSKEYAELSERSLWWKNAIDPETGYARLRKSDGSWFPDFDPFQSGRNQHYVEGNAWQLTFFVPQDVPSLAKTIGEQRFKDRLAWGFQESERWRFNAPNDAYWDYPVIQGNQQSMHFAYLFNYVNQPWLTQKWSRSIIDRYYGSGLANAYLGDEDQGQMSAWFIMSALGLFQIDGGSRTDPVYEIGSPIFQKVEIDLGSQYGRGKSFVIEAKNASRKNIYVQSATLNGRSLDSFWFPASELLKGGKLVLEMGEDPNVQWGMNSLPPQAK